MKAIQVPMHYWRFKMLMVRGLREFIKVIDEALVVESMGTSQQLMGGWQGIQAANQNAVSADNQASSIKLA